MIGSGRAWESSKADLIVSAGGVLKSQWHGENWSANASCFGREMIAGQERTLELGDFNVMTEEQPALLD